MITPKQTLFLLLLCLLAAAGLRLAGLADPLPGPHYDEAANAILVGDIGLRGERPIFIGSYTGKEVLFFYPAALLARLVGNTLFSLRLTAVFFGLLTVAATYPLGRALGLDRRAALLAAGLLAVSFWHLIFSRLGFRAISQPLLQALTVLALFYGLRRDSWPWLTAGGLFLGLTGYTYLAARLFPLLLAAGLSPFILARGEWRRRVGQLAFVVFVAALTLSPLLYYFWQNPEAFWVRIGQVSPETSFSLAESYGRSLAMFFLLGDPYWRFNLPNQPIFNWFWGGLLLAGAVFLGQRGWRTERPFIRAGVLLLLLTPLIMILPTALATGEIVPSNLRAIGLLPFLYYLPAYGLFALLERLAAYRTTRQQNQMIGLNRLSVASLLILLLIVGLPTAWSYFQLWLPRSDLFYETDSDLAAVAYYLNENPPLEGERIYLAALHYRHPTVAFLSEQYEAVNWLPQSEALVWPEMGGARIVYPHSSPAPDWARSLLAGAAQQSGPDGPDGEPQYVVYQLNAPPTIEPPHIVNANFGQTITLIGYQPGGATSGGALPLTLYWRVDRLPAADFMPFVHLTDERRYRWSQAETFVYPAAQWQPGETIVQRVEVPIPSGTPPGYYFLQVGLFDPATGDRLPRLDEALRYAGDTVAIQSGEVTAGTPPAPLPQSPYAIAKYAPGLRLFGYERGATTAFNGERLWLALWWEASAPLPPMSNRLELMRPDGTGIILSNSQPVDGRYPFHQWATPQFLIDRQTPRLPANLTAGTYRLQLRLLDAADRTLFTADLGPLELLATERQFTAPPPQFPQAALFGETIRLLGYDLTPLADGVWELTLLWQAARETAVDYTVFVHLQGLDGVCCLWQQDVMPRQGQYPTSRWLAEEIVGDSYRITPPPDLPPGLYPLEVGLYIAETGQRLVVAVPGLPDNDALRLRPLPVE
jgi:4-amino-4-deoxy-L-arabinose transferase-like glycosyltransferase